DDALTEAVLNSAANRLARPRDTLLEDMGTYLVSHPHLEPLRRLLRFGGVTFVDFLHSLDDLPSRGRLAVPELELPQLELVARSDHQFTLYCRGAGKGYGHVMVGVLRAMADDYGALVLLDYDGSDVAVETVAINLLEHHFAEGRRFSLASHVGSL
ncbi:MAG: heme NO-binding domain-containing protein, partial [Paracoccaceae bacterium]|nr:heme NO-binding domain-containing protein [Paracoccaceae bacterium]